MATMYGEKISFNSVTAESTLATITLADDVSEFKRAINVKVTNKGPGTDEFTGEGETVTDLVVSFQYYNGSAWADVSADLTDDTIVKCASKVYNVYLPKGNQLRVRGSGETRGYIEIEGDRSNRTYRPDSPLSDQTGVL